MSITSRYISSNIVHLAISIYMYKYYRPKIDYYSEGHNKFI
jgi:hypothetical protein